MNSQKKIGIFGGTFDPIHFGHINLAIEVLEKRDLDEIWFTPVNLSPHKTETPPTSVNHRVNMILLATEDIEPFRLLDIETKREGPSYTIDTINEVEKLYPDHNFHLVMSEEVLPNFMQWHQPEEIAQKVPFIVASRFDNSLKAPFFDSSDPIRHAVEAGWTPTTIMEISATEIRQRLKNRLYCGHLVPNKVLDYIYANQLYYYI